MAILQGARITGSIIATQFIKASGFSGSLTASNLYVLGKAGIGTTSPTAKLEIAGFSTGAGLKLNYGNSSGTIEAVNFIANGGANGVIGMQMVSAGVGDLWLGGSGGRTLTLYRDGNVGIGTTSPSNTKLHIVGDWVSGHSTVKSQTITSFSSGGTAGYGTYDSDGTRWGYLYSYSTGTSVGSSNDSPLILETNGTEKVRITSGGNVGIGTSSPGRKLHLYGPQSVIKLSNTGTGAWSGFEWSVGNGSYTAYSGLLDDTGRYFIDIGSNGDDFTILQNGNVGIGTTSPLAKLSVGNGSLSDSNLPVQISTAAASGTAYFGANKNGAYGALFGFDNAGFAGVVVRNVVSSGASGDAISFVVNNTTTAVYIKSDGNVGIGTTSPGAKLQVDVSSASGIRVNGTGGYANILSQGGHLEFYKDSTPTYAAAIGLSTPATALSNDIQFATYNGSSWSARMTIANGGYVGIGTTNPSGIFHAANLGTANTTADNFSAYFSSVNRNASIFLLAKNTEGSAFYFGDGDSNTVGALVYEHTTNYLRVDVNGSERMRINSDGNVGIGTTSPAEKLEVKGNLKLDNSGYGWIYGSDTNHSIILRADRSGTASNETNYYQYGGTLAAGKGHKFWTGGALVSQTLKMQIADDGTYIVGNVGIGTTSTNNKLDVVSATANNGSPFAGCFFSGDDSSAMWRCAINLQHNANTTIAVGSSIGLSFAPLSSTTSNFYGSAAIKAVRPNTTANNQDTDLAFWTRTGASNNTVDTEKVRITGNGSVLIGVNGAYNSSRLLQVKDGLLIGNSFYTFASIDTSGTADLILSSNANPANLGSNSNIIFKLGTSAGGGPEERMRIVSNGNVGIGTSSPTQKLHVVGNVLSSYNILTSVVKISSASDAASYISVDGYTAGLSYAGTYIGLASLPGFAVFANLYIGGGFPIIPAGWSGTISGIAYANAVNLASSVLLQTSPDGSTWTTRSQTSAPSGTETLTYSVSDSATPLYVRFTLRQDSGGTVAANDCNIQNIIITNLQSLPNKPSISNRFIVNGAGNVGIGTSSPANKLHVSGSSTNLPLKLEGLTSNATGYFLTVDNTTGVVYKSTGGANGTSGTSGANGSPGSPGSSGTNGTSGTSGANGNPGTSGTSGANGNAGSSGITGTSGTSGDTNIKAWIHFNGTGTPSSNASNNVSSITDNGTGDYTINFTTAFSNANYVVAGTATYQYENPGQSINNMFIAVPRRPTAQLAGSCRISTPGSDNVLYDCDYVRVLFSN